MLLALDYDDTYTVDPVFWELVIAAAHHRGHEVIVVTYRFEEWDNLDIKNTIGGRLHVVYTNGKQKRPETIRQGYDVDVWIDDMPELIP